jgi:hypothetical protein
MLAARPPLEGLRQRQRASEERTQSRRAARGLDSVRIVRAWKVLTASGPTGMVLDVYNGGRWLVTGLVVELDDVDGETRKPTHHTCQMGVVIPAGRVARVSCYKAIIDPERVEPRIVGVHWR